MLAHFAHPTTKRSVLLHDEYPYCVCPFDVGVLMCSLAQASLPKSKLIEKIEQLQKTPLRIIFPQFKYKEALATAVTALHGCQATTDNA